MFHSDPGTPDLLWLTRCELNVTGDGKENKARMINADG